METAWANEASSSSSISTQFKYDVFLSFRGVDTRYNFTSHLLDALKRHGFRTFRDDTELSRGEYINDALLKAIEESRLSLVILSENYAASRWCLDELVKIMECRKTLQQIVLPIFYNVEPSDVRAQRGSLAEAFAKHEERLKDCSDGRVKKWREALTEVANLSGWDLPKEANGDEARLIQKVVEEVQNNLGIVHRHVARHEIGLESRLQNLKLKMESANVRIIAVWGMGGIGKTTLVKKLYNLIQHEFKSSCFLANIGETSKQLNGLVVLQEKLLSDVLRTGTHNIKNVDHGIEVIKQRACRQKVLLILDDVDDVQQLKALAIDQDSFCFGSRIVVTTRDISLLNVLKEYEKYEAEELNEDESLKLFSLHCFKEDHPTEDHLDLSRQVVHHAGGLPLALEILGSFFRGKSIPEWKSAIAKLREIPDDKITKKLEISFDSLNKEEQDLFLDMACFFVGTSRDFTLKILEACGRYAVIGIRVLADRCLIKYDWCNTLVMHDMVRDMGREIVRQESRENPGERSRLWHDKDVLDVLRRGTGTGKVEGLLLNTKDVQVNAKPFEASRDSMGTKAVEDVKVNAKAFEKMNNLWLLHLDYVHQTADFEHASRRLLWLSWKGFPFDCLPWDLSMEELIALDLRYSSLKKVWNGYKTLGKLKFLYLSHCHYLTRTPDFSELKSLEELLLNDCKSLVEVDESIRYLNKLLVLDMSNCTKLRKLPSGIWMLKSLECLDISGCSKLGNLAVFKGPLNALRCLLFSYWTWPPNDVNSLGFSLTSVQASSCLKELKLANCSLSYLPDEIGNLISLQSLDLQRNNLITLPDRICNLTCLKRLNLGWNNVSHLPSEIGNLISLQSLDLLKNNLITLPDRICNLTCLKHLNLRWNNVSHLPSEIGNLISLQSLDLQQNNLITLPDRICNLTCLKRLDLGSNNVSHLPSEIGNLISLQHLNLQRNNLITLPDGICNLTCLESLVLGSNNVSHLPSEIGRLTSLWYLNLGSFTEPQHPRCKSLMPLTLPHSIWSLTQLGSLSFDGCDLSHLPGEIGNLVSLKNLGLAGTNICTLPDSISNLDRLGWLRLRRCAKLQSLPKLPGGCQVDAEDCASLESLPLELDQLGWITTCSDSSYKLVENDFANRLLEQLRRSKGLAEIEEVVDVTVPSVGDVPIWFPYQGDVRIWSAYQGNGSYVSFVVPPLVKQKLLGWVICVFSHNQELSGLIGVSVSRNKIEKELIPCSGGSHWLDKDQVWVRYIPQGYSGWHLEGGDEVKISIRHTLKLRTVVNVRWGVDLIYEVDENITKTNENQEALIQYTSALNQNVSLPEDFSSDKKRRRTF